MVFMDIACLFTTASLPVHYLFYFTFLSELLWLCRVIVHKLNAYIIRYHMLQQCNNGHAKRYKYAMIRKRCSQKEISTPKTEVGKTKLAITYLYLENIS